MLGVLQSILCVLRNILTAILHAGAEVLNFGIKGLAALMVEVFGALPQMPEVPQLPAAAASAVGWLAWAFPVTQFVAAFVALLATYLLFMTVSIALRWVKAL